MSDDIITRLRGKEHGTDGRRCEGCDNFCCHCELCDCCLEILEVCLQAADEIERLRAEIVIALKPKDIWHDCSHCQGHEPSDNG